MITMYDFDVIVVGGGFSGVAAAIGSSRLGVKTLLVEKSGVLGGTPILSLVNPFMRWRTNGKDVVKGVFKEILDRLKAKSEWGFSSIFDPEILKDILFEMVIKNNVDLMLYSTVIDVEGKNIVIYSRGKKWRVEGKIIVDATGDGDIAYIMGADFMYGRDKDGRVQPVTLMFRVGGINFLEMLEYLEKNPSEVRVNVNYLRKCIENNIPFGLSGFYGLVKKAMERNDFPNIPQINYIFPSACFPSRGEAIFNNTRVMDVNTLDPKDLTQATITARRQINKLVSFLRKYVPGFEKCYLLQTPPYIGVRESRRIVGEYILTLEDLINCREFPDTIARGCYSIDIHPLTRNEKLLWIDIPPGKSYTIPYRCLIPRKIDNLIMAGRAISATHEALGAIRVIPNITAIGHAAGVAAGLSVKYNVSPREMDVNIIQKELIKQGAVIWV